jgi:hypothetical protein
MSAPSRTSTLDPRTAAVADPALAERSAAQLSALLTACRSASPRVELTGAGAALAAVLATDHGDDPDALRLDALLARGGGAPIALGALAVTAARGAGIALGLLAGPHGRLALAHALLAEPLVLDLGASFAPRRIAGEEPLHRWVCAHEAARRVQDAWHAACRPAAVVALAS